MSITGPQNIRTYTICIAYIPIFLHVSSVFIFTHGNVYIYLNLKKKNLEVSEYIFLLMANLQDEKIKLSFLLSLISVNLLFITILNWLPVLCIKFFSITSRT